MKIKLIATILLVPLLLQGQGSALEVKGLPPFKPQDEAFWFEVDSGLKDPNNTYVILLSDQKAESAPKDSLLQSEALLGLARGLLRDGFSFAATIILTEIVKSKQGTSVALEALKDIEGILKKYPVEEEGPIFEIIFDLDHDIIPPPESDFIKFYSGLLNQKLGFTKWAEEDFKNISENSHWDFKLRYLEAVNLVNKGQILGATEGFLKLYEDPLTPQTIKGDSAHQYARLLFETGEYEKAYDIFTKVELNPRGRGFILLERAWTKYYLRDYGKALGLLTALEAPVFDPSRSPESYLLKMLIYKELCYYESAYTVMDEFKSKYSNSITRIRKRADLRRDPMIVNMTMFDRSVGQWVDLFNQLKLERDRLDSDPYNKISRYGELKNLYNLRIRQVAQKLDKVLMPKVRVAADELLDWQEQISFLDYQTRVDALRVTRGNELSPIAYDPIPVTSFEKIYWIFDGEYWLDELESLQVYVESQCDKRGGSSTP